MTAPVAFFIFNRPALTLKVFEAIRQAKPQKLFVIADGPRTERRNEAEKCAATRAVIEQVDWDCEVFKNYSDVNLGCGQRVSTGISWVFEQVEEAMILEDDCLPHPSFFPFCTELLEKYKNEPKIMTITGTNWLGEWKPQQQSYHFNFCGGFWGWATWRRAWQGYDYDLKLWANEEAKERVRDFIADDKHFHALANVCSQAYNKEVDAWSYQWLFQCCLHSGIEVVPSVNLISNIGFGQDAAHTKNAYDVRSKIPLSPLLFPLKEPDAMVIDRKYFNMVSKRLSKNNHPILKLRNKINKLFSKVNNAIALTRSA
ncbi:glycosyltransferase family 2 protein [Nostoc sp. CENA67]|uniref:Glycosyltransferase family 2 protein n=1 Tax=Amazonocrinis nigriterrae CENA67 TaxID=2794033 RepID=A0A8J7HTU0_9NOST|nr:glycosyltransferase family 2 protein [Amazonocrinis nigriterrae]MBH8563643.1 glycosyltransferase family 2 protein [Amazonocrinis nigriterrae CENA67]